MGNDYIYNGIIGRRFRERQGREEYMSKISLFLFFVLMHAATAQSQYTYQPIDLGTNWIVSNDNQGGLCYSDGTQIDGLVSVLRLRRSRVHQHEE